MSEYIGPTPFDNLDPETARSWIEAMQQEGMHVPPDLFAAAGLPYSRLVESTNMSHDIWPPTYDHQDAIDAMTSDGWLPQGYLFVGMEPQTAQPVSVDLTEPTSLAQWGPSLVVADTRVSGRNMLMSLAQSVRYMNPESPDVGYVIVTSKPDAWDADILDAPQCRGVWSHDEAPNMLWSVPEYTAVLIDDMSRLPSDTVGQHALQQLLEKSAIPDKGIYTIASIESAVLYPPVVPPATDRNKTFDYIHRNDQYLLDLWKTRIYGRVTNDYVAKALEQDNGSTLCDLASREYQIHRPDGWIRVYIPTV